MAEPQNLAKRYYKTADIKALLEEKHRPGEWNIEVGLTPSSACTLAVTSSQDANSLTGRGRVYYRERTSTTDKCEIASLY